MFFLILKTYTLNSGTDPSGHVKTSLDLPPIPKPHFIIKKNC